MIVPEYWAEARVQKKLPDRQITVRRFGWSDVSEEDAQRLADERAHEALDRIVRGENLTRREKRVGYGGADGVPIREEIVDRYEDCVVTRNSYGARCLNSPDLFIADIDWAASFTESCSFAVILFAGGILCGIATLAITKLMLYAIIAWLVCTVLIGLLMWGLESLLVKLRGGSENIALKRIQRFTRNHPAWHLRLYRTPNGFRLIAMHQLLDPRSMNVSDAFSELGVDRIYATMCKKQNCFRARLTAKPWRIGMRDRIKPRSAWPVAEEYLPSRQLWVDEYESSAENYAACRFEQAIGSVHQVDPKARAIVRYHDQCCRAESELPIA